MFVCVHFPQKPTYTRVISMSSRVGAEAENQAHASVVSSLPSAHCAPLHPRLFLSLPVCSRILGTHPHHCSIFHFLPFMDPNGLFIFLHLLSILCHQRLTRASRVVAQGCFVASHHRGMNPTSTAH